MVEIRPWAVQGLRGDRQGYQRQREEDHYFQQPHLPPSALGQRALAKQPPLLRSPTDRRPSLWLLKSQIGRVKMIGLVWVCRRLLSSPPFVLRRLAPRSE